MKKHGYLIREVASMKYFSESGTYGIPALTHEWNPYVSGGPTLFKKKEVALDAIKEVACHFSRPVTDFELYEYETIG